jgi:hypothetical protein
LNSNKWSVPARPSRHFARTRKRFGADPAMNTQAFPLEFLEKFFPELSRTRPTSVELATNMDGTTDTLRRSREECLASQRSPRSPSASDHFSASAEDGAMMTLLQGLHAIAAQRGDGLGPELLEAILRTRSLHRSEHDDSGRDLLLGPRRVDDVSSSKQRVYLPTHRSSS